MKPICIIGHSRHGKDEAAMALHGRGDFRFCGSLSWHALAFMPAIVGLPAQFAWERRHEQRELWKHHCDEFRRYDPLRLVRMALQHGNIVSGIRDKVEIEAALKEDIFEAILWVNRPGFPDDPTLSYNPQSFCTDRLDNGNTLDSFRFRVVKWAEWKGWL